MDVTMKLFMTIILPIITLLAGGVIQLILAADKPGNWQVIVSETFDDGLASWQSPDPDAWRIEEFEGNKVASQFQQSKVITPVRSPFNRAVLSDVEVGSFQYDVKFRSTARDYPHRSLCLFFGVQDKAHLYYVHFGQKTDDHANQVFIVNDAPRTKISTKTTEGTPWDDQWHHARIVRDVDTGRIDVFFDDMEKPAMTAVDKTFTSGRVGIGSFDDTGYFDDITLRVPGKR